MNYDVLILGAGVSGSAIARELAKTNLRVAVLEKEEDVCCGTSKANSGIVHAGYDAKPGSLKAKLNVRGNAMMEELAKTLHFDFQRNGSLVLCFDEQERKGIEELYVRGQTNGVEGLEIWEKEAILAKEPSISSDVVCALYAPSAGIVCPFGLTIALAENACDNGVDFYFDTPALSAEYKKGQWIVNDRFQAKVIINATGVQADNVHSLVETAPFSIHPRKGEYFLLDHEAIHLCSMTLFQQPSALGKGVLIAPTVHNNILVGPTAENILDKEQTSTSFSGMETIRSKAKQTIKEIPYGAVITSFAGSRAVGDREDFIIEETMENWIDVAGIESPGLTSAPAIGEMVAQMIKEKLQPEENLYFDPSRKGFVSIKDLNQEDWNALIQNDPSYGTIICRCETISEGEIKEACSRSIPAKSLDGVKRRVRAGMGRCQGGFCSPKVMEIIAREQAVPFSSISKSGQESELIVGCNKEEAYDE